MFKGGILSEYKCLLICMYTYLCYAYNAFCLILPHILCVVLYTQIIESLNNTIELFFSLLQSSVILGAHLVLYLKDIKV